MRLNPILTATMLAKFNRGVEASQFHWHPSVSRLVLTSPHPQGIYQSWDTWNARDVPLRQRAQVAILLISVALRRAFANT